jgi:hypothetical protein
MTDKEVTFVLNCYRDMAGKDLNDVICVPSKDMIAVVDYVKQQKAEINELQLKNAELQLKIDELRANNKAIMQTIAGVREEVAKEFAKKIEDTTWYSINSEGELVVGANGGSDVPLYKADDILEIAKEMVGYNSETIESHGKWLPDYETFVDENGYESEPIQTGFFCSACGAFGCKEDSYCKCCGSKMHKVGDNE